MTRTLFPNHSMTDPIGFLPQVVAQAGEIDPEKMGPLLKALHNFPALRPVADFFDGTLGFGLAQPGLPEIFFATFLSFGLTALIAGLYKSTFRGAKLSQDYVHTLMILGIVVTVMVMVVRGGDRHPATAAGFGRF